MRAEPAPCPATTPHDELPRCPARRGRAGLGDRGRPRPRRHRGRRAAHVRRGGAPSGLVRPRRRRRHGRPDVGRVRRRASPPGAPRWHCWPTRSNASVPDLGRVPRRATPGGRRRGGRPSRRGRPRDRLGPRRPDARRRGGPPLRRPARAPDRVALAWRRLRPPPGAQRLAGSVRYPIQAFRAGRTAWGVQFHIEVTPAAVDGMLRAFPQDAALAAGGAAAVIRTHARGTGGARSLA